MRSHSPTTLPTPAEWGCATGSALCFPSSWISFSFTKSSTVSIERSIPTKTTRIWESFLGHWEGISHGRAGIRAEAFPILRLNTHPIHSSVPQALIQFYLKAIIPLKAFSSWIPLLLPIWTWCLKHREHSRQISIAGSPVGRSGLLPLRAPSLPSPVWGASIPSRVTDPLQWAKTWCSAP